MTIDELGEIRREFKPGLANLIAGIIIGLLLIGGGCAALYVSANGVIESRGNLPFWTAKDEKGWSWGAAALMTVVGGGMIVGGALLIQWVCSLFSFRVRVGQFGVAVYEKKAVRVFDWKEIVSVQETRLHERPPILKGIAKYALPKMLSKSFLVRLKRGEPFAFDGNTIQGHIDLAQMIREQTERRNVLWEIVEEQGY